MSLSLDKKLQNGIYCQWLLNHAKETFVNYKNRYIQLFRYYTQILPLALKWLQWYLYTNNTFRLK